VTRKTLRECREDELNSELNFGKTRAEESDSSDFPEDKLAGDCESVKISGLDRPEAGLAVLDCRPPFGGDPSHSSSSSPALASLASHLLKG
jgi:hypothetical protein